MRRNSLIIVFIIITIIFSSCIPNVATNKELKSENNIPYGPDQIKSGDIISGMKVRDSKLSVVDKFDNNNDFVYSIQFSGEFELSGKLAINDETGHYYFSNDELVSEKLPLSSFEDDIESDKQEKLNIMFDITNEDELVDKLKEGIKDFQYGDEVKVRGIFSDYYFWLYELEYGHAAKLNKIVKITR